MNPKLVTGAGSLSCICLWPPHFDDKSPMLPANYAQSTIESRSPPGVTELVEIES